MEVLGYVAAVLMGLTMGLFGAGGGILTVPILVYLFGVSPTIATGESLLLVGLAAGLGALSFWRSGEVHRSAVLAFGGPSLIGTYVARRWLLPSLPDPVVGSVALDTGLMLLFATAMCVAAWAMIRKPREVLAGARPRALAWLVPWGLGVGILSGTVGAGGGFMIVPVMLAWGRMELRVATGTSLTIIAVQSLVGFGGQVQVQPVQDGALLGTLLLLALLGLGLGKMLANRAKPEQLRPAFGWFVLAMATVICLRELPMLF